MAEDYIGYLSLTELHERLLVVEETLSKMERIEVWINSEIYDMLKQLQGAVNYHENKLNEHIDRSKRKPRNILKLEE